MQTQWHELRERLLRAGIAHRHIRRYISELDDHLADLRTEEQFGGRTPAEGADAACARLGTIDQLARAMEVRPELRSWSARLPVLVFGVGPVFAIAAAYMVALTILWTGWNLYLPYSMTPFVRLRGMEILWFGTGRLIYFAAPVLVGWAVALLAIRQRLGFRWPSIALGVLAVIGATAHVHTSRPGAGWRSNHVRLSFGFGEFHSIGNHGQTIGFQLLSPGVLHMALLFAMAALPYLAWRSHRALALSG